jgi:hypothetical protein
VTHGRGSDGETGEWSGYPVHFTLPRNLVYPALLPLMRTPRLPVVDWTDAPVDLNGLVRFDERRNLVSARVPLHFKRSLTIWIPRSACVLPISGTSPCQTYASLRSYPTSLKVISLTRRCDKVAANIENMECKLLLIWKQKVILWWDSWFLLLSNLYQKMR